MGAFDPVGLKVRLEPGEAKYRVHSVDPALHRYLKLIFDSAYEERLHVIYVDAAQRYLYDETLARGRIDRIVSRVRPIFERALALGAGGVLLSHNHPSGDCRPSEEDVVSTRRLRDIGEALEVRLLDHLIFTRERCFSMATGGYL